MELVIYNDKSGNIERVYPYLVDCLYDNYEKTLYVTFYKPSQHEIYHTQFKTIKFRICL